MCIRDRVDTFVSHQNADDIAMMAAMNLSAEQFPMKTETSPKKLRGLTHREIGDYSDALVAVSYTHLKDSRDLTEVIKLMYSN